MSAAAEVQRPQRAPDPESDEVWVRARDAAPAKPDGAAPTPRRREKALPPALKDELDKAAGRKESGRLHDRLEAAARAYDHDRYQEARRYLRALADEAQPRRPFASCSVSRCTASGSGRPPSRNSRPFTPCRDRSTSTPSSPTATAPAVRPPSRGVWEELRQASPGAELVAEGRIVAAAPADQGDLTGAIDSSARPEATSAPPRPPHAPVVRPRRPARASRRHPPGPEIFGRVARHDPTFFDAAARARDLALTPAPLSRLAHTVRPSASPAAVFSRRKHNHESRCSHRNA